MKTLLKNELLDGIQNNKKLLTNEHIKKLVKLVLERNKKDRTINSSKLNSLGFLEFRSIGGENYHKRISEIKYSIKRIMYTLYLASNENIRKKEYYSKLGKIVIELKSAKKNEK